MADLDSQMDFELTALLAKVSAPVLACHYCQQSITYQNRAPFNGDGTPHRCLTMGTLKCNRCNASIKFESRKPFNLNGTPHRCIAEEAERDKMWIDTDTGELIPPGSRKK